jgi:hypothetical protein
MLLQDLFKEENANLTQATSVIINEESANVEYSTPPLKLTEISFVLKLDADGMMDETLMDIIIGYRLTNVNIIVEVPSDYITSEKLEVKYLLQLASNVDFSLALLPPGNDLVGSEVTVAQYKEIIVKVLDEMLNKPNFDKFVYPISNFFEYLMLEQILGKKKLNGFRPENKYVVQTFANIMSQEDSDDFKAVIRSKLYDFYGGEKEFDLVAKTILEGIFEKAKDMYKDMVVSSINIEKQNQETDQAKSAD